MSCYNILHFLSLANLFIFFRASPIYLNYRSPICVFCNSLTVSYPHTLIDTLEQKCKEKIPKVR